MKQPIERDSEAKSASLTFWAKLHPGEVDLECTITESALNAL